MDEITPATGVATITAPDAAAAPPPPPETTTPRKHDKPVTIEERLAALRARKARLKAKEQRLHKDERTRDTHQKVVLGGALLAWAKATPEGHTALAAVWARVIEADKERLVERGFKPPT